MADKNVDILMYIKDGSNGIDADGLSEIDTDDDFMAGFVSGKFFEVDDFDFGIQAVDTDSSTRSSKSEHGDKEGAEKSKPKSGQFATWIKNKAVSMDGGAFPAELKPFNFTRQIDIASPLLVQRCFQTKPYLSAALVMRRAGGSQFGDQQNIGGLPFLRIDFSTVLITSVDWDAGEVVKEKCSFVCRGVQVKYRRQAHAGTGAKETGGLKMSLVSTSS